MSRKPRNDNTWAIAHLVQSIRNLQEQAAAAANERAAERRRRRRAAYMRRRAERRAPPLAILRRAIGFIADNAYLEISAAELAAWLKISKSALKRALAAAAELGFIFAEPSRADKRRRRYNVSAAELGKLHYWVMESAGHLMMINGSLIVPSQDNQWGQAFDVFAAAAEQAYNSTQAEPSAEPPSNVTKQAPPSQAEPPSWIKPLSEPSRFPAPSQAAERRRRQKLKRILPSAAELADYLSLGIKNK